MLATARDVKGLTKAEVSTVLPPVDAIDGRLGSDSVAGDTDGTQSCWLSQQRPRRVVDEQLAVADVAGEHGVAGVAGLLSDLP